MSKTINQNIQKIEEKQVERVSSGSIHIKLECVGCLNCGSCSLRRTVSAYTRNYTKPDVKFNCMQCGHTDRSLYVRGKEMEFEEYREFLKQEI